MTGSLGIWLSIIIYTLTFFCLLLFFFFQKKNRKWEIRIKITGVSRNPIKSCYQWVSEEERYTSPALQHQVGHRVPPWPAAGWPRQRQGPAPRPPHGTPVLTFGHTRDPEAVGLEDSCGAGRPLTWAARDRHLCLSA